MQTLKRNQLLKWEKKVANHEYGDRFLSLQRKPGRVLKQFVWKVKSQWRQRQRQRQRSGMHFSYDLHSYSLNFDDGVFSS
ncbi:hypothetical protein V6N13_087328 [Hibiscus sabdariffa]